MIKFILIFFTLVFPVGVYCQNPSPTKDSCLVEITLSDFDEFPIIYCDLICTTAPQGDKLKCKTDKNGKAKVLIPKKKRKTYLIKCDYRGDKFEFAKVFSIPEDEGAYTLTVDLKYQSKYMVLAELEFKNDDAKLLESSDRELGRLLEMLNLKPGMEIEISGHTDSIGKLEHNMQLSDKRALSVKNYLISKDVNGQRIYTKGYGPFIPLAPNDTEEGRQRNRRIEVKVVKE